MKANFLFIRRERRVQRATGYTLLEVLIGSILVSIAILAVVQAIGQSSKIAKRDFLRRRAYQYLEQILEKPEHGYRGNYYLQGRLGTASPLSPAIDPPRDLGQVSLDDRDTRDETDDLMADISLMVESIPPADIDLFGNAHENVPALKLSAMIEWQFQGITERETLQTIVTLVDIN